MRVFGFAVPDPLSLGATVADELASALRALAAVPAQIDRLITLGEEMATTGRRVVELGERMDARAEQLLTLGDRIDARARELLDVGATVETLANRIDERGEEIVRRAGEVVEAGGELIGVIPTLERAIEMTTPLEGAIDRFGRLVDRLPGGPGRRRLDELPPETDR